MDFEHEIMSLSAETFAVQTVLAHVLDRVGRLILQSQMRSGSASMMRRKMSRVSRLIWRQCRQPSHRQGSPNY
jgi:hypothetical protein